MASPRSWNGVLHFAEPHRDPRVPLAVFVFVIVISLTVGLASLLR